MINRYQLVTRHNPILHIINYESPLSVGNGEFAYTADITGMQTLYEEHESNHVPLCTMSQWGWHTTPVSKDKYCYTTSELEMTEYEFAGRKVTYAVEKKEGNEEVYDWLRQNPHRLNLARIGLVWNGEDITEDSISPVHQELKLYEGVLESKFFLFGTCCEVSTVCDYQKDRLGFRIKSSALGNGMLKVKLAFPYGSSHMTASDWNSDDRHMTEIIEQTESRVVLKRTLDRDSYYVTLQGDDAIDFITLSNHAFALSSMSNELFFTIHFSKSISDEFSQTTCVFENSQNGWKAFWENGAAIDLHKSKDKRANELERRIILSQYLCAIQSCGSIPPQETGLTCNSWYGKFHLEMHLWHSAHLPLWNRPELLEKSLHWYEEHLPQARENAARNGYIGARWPKMAAYDGSDSPSHIATLLIWQQPHIIYMLELIYKSNEEKAFLETHWNILKESADFMCSFANYNPSTKKFDLISPIIPAQEEHKPATTVNPSFEIEYWRFTLYIASKWAKRLGYDDELWQNVADNMADIPKKDGLYLAHENCPTTFEEFNRDHPSMLLAYGLIHSNRISHKMMEDTLRKVLQCWDFSTMWGWDFALMAMTAVRLGDPDTAIDILLKDTPKNTYVTSGNNFQKLRTDLPLYLPGNGSLLLVIPLMTAGYGHCQEPLPGFPKNGMWEVEYEDLKPFPY